MSADQLDLALWQPAHAGCAPVAGSAPVKLRTSWYDLLGTDCHTYAPAERRARWEKWKKMAHDAGDSEMVEYWSDADGCQGCIHADGDWCSAMELPCSINPLLTMKHGMIGMACGGAGHEQNDSGLASAPQDSDS